MVIEIKAASERGGKCSRRVRRQAERGRVELVETETVDDVGKLHGPKSGAAGTSGTASRSPICETFVFERRRNARTMLRFVKRSNVSSGNAANSRDSSSGFGHSPFGGLVATTETRSSQDSPGAVSVSTGIPWHEAFHEIHPVTTTHGEMSEMRYAGMAPSSPGPAGAN